MAKNILAAFVILLKLPFLIIGSMLKHPKALIVVVLIVIGVTVFRTLDKPAPPPQTLFDIPIPYYQEKEPSKEKAPTVIQTFAPDRVYYVSAYNDNGQSIVLHGGGFSMYNRENWEIGKLPLTLDRANYKEIRIYKR